MMLYAHILGEAPVRLWGLSSGQRIRRVLEGAGVTDVVEDLGSVPDGGSVLILRGDYLFDNRVVNNLVKSPNVVLELPSAASRVAVAAHVPGGLRSQVMGVLRGTADTATLSGVRLETPESLSPSFHETLLKSDPPFVEPITQERRRVLEERLFSGSYKGVTDLVTKWVWPVPAQCATQVCVRFGIRPNHVTVLSLLLVVVAGISFAYGLYGWGLLAGWLMTFLDTVDGKLARVTVTSSQFGNVLDKGLDLIHPPLWYIAWGLGLQAFHPGISGVTLDLVLWLILGGYIAGRLIEGVFLVWLGAFGIFCWRPIDSYIRLITARRNPNLILLTVSLVAGRPDLGLVAVAFWTIVSSLLLLLRVLLALRARIVSGPLRSWLADLDGERGRGSFAVRLFTGQRAAQSLGKAH